MEERILFDGQLKIDTAGRVFKKTYGYWREVAKPNGKNAYRVVSVTKDGWHKSISVHRLVAMTFIPNPDNKTTINHKNGNKQDNRVENLEWVSHRENIQHAYRTGINKGQRNICTMCGKETRNQKYHGICTCKDCRKKYALTGVTRKTDLTEFLKQRNDGIWYACVGDQIFSDWSHGSLSLRKAIEMARENDSKRVDVIAVLNNGFRCINRIYKDDFDSFYKDENYE